MRRRVGFSVGTNVLAGGPRFIFADAYVVMKHAGVQVFDHTITDPPFTDQVHSKMLAGKKASGVRDAYVRKVNANFTAINASLEFVGDCIRATKRWLLFNCALEQLGDYQRTAPASWIRSGIYTKVRAMPQMTGDRPGNRCEGIAVLHGATKKRWNGGGTHAYWVAMPENRKALRHPTGKPLMLCMRIIEQFTDPGDFVFDPFCGSGSYGLACALLGRRYLGVDNGVHEEEQRPYVEIAYEKLDSMDRPALMKKYEIYKAKYCKGKEDA